MSVGTSWVVLIAAGLLEPIWVVALQRSEGLTRMGYATLALTLAAVSLVLLALSLRNLPAGPAYAAWTGIGSVAIVLSGAALLDESLTATRVACIAAIVTGVVGLRLDDG